MTSKEALERLRKRICCEKPEQHFCSDKCLYDEDDCEISLAIKALEKQIPKKPRNTEKWGMDRIMLGHCPICGAKLNGDMKFCNKCGQALDWSDEG